jgi:hypothetical protein
VKLRIGSGIREGYRRRDRVGEVARIRRGCGITPQNLLRAGGFPVSIEFLPSPRGARMRQIESGYAPTSLPE